MLVKTQKQAGPRDSATSNAKPATHQFIPTAGVPGIATCDVSVPPAVIWSESAEYTIKVCGAVSCAGKFPTYQG
jgi:hypothetical protein